MAGTAHVVYSPCGNCSDGVPPDAMFCPNCGAGVHGAGQGPVIDGFTILRPVGRGGAAVVYLARQESLQREVAVKVLRLEVDDPRVWRSFRREARSIAQLSGHPHVLTVYTAGHGLTGQPYLVTEYMDRGSLADAIAADGALPPRAVARLGVAVADALIAAHEVGILHRDVKPGNVLLAHDGRVKLGDFGIARLLAGSSSSTTNMAAFTPEHVAPEILRGEPDGTWSDVYGLGSTLAEAATGRPLFLRRPDERVEALLARKLTAPPPQLQDSLPGPLATLLTRALDPSPDRRPRLEEVRDDLSAFAAAASSASWPAPVGAPMPDPHVAPDSRTRAAPAVAPIVEELRTRRRRRHILLPLAAVVALLLIGTTLAVRAGIGNRGNGKTAGTAAEATSVATTVPAAGTVAPPPAPTTVAPTPASAATTVDPTGLSPTKAASTTTPPSVAAEPPVAPATNAPPSPTQPAAGAITAQEAETFLIDYYDAVAAGDYATSWALLAPEFQRGKAHSYEYYTSFWDQNDIEVLDVRFVSADGDQALVDADLRWNGQTRQQTDRFTLRRGDSGSLLIARQVSL